MPVLKTLVATEIKTAFQAKAGMAHVSESDLLRSVVMQSLELQPPSPPMFAIPEPVAIEQLTVRMASPLMQMTRARAASAGMSASRWIASLVKSNLSNAPIMTDSETEALRACNRELAVISRNLVHLTRVLRENPAETERLKCDQLAQLSDVVAANREVIQSLIRASQQYWGALQ